MEEKIRVYITGFLNFEKITKLPLTASSTSRLPAPCLWPGRTPATPPVLAAWPRPRPNRPRAPTVCPLAVPSGCTGERHASPTPWKAATTSRAMQRSPSPASAPCPAESTSPGWRTALPGAPSLSFTAYKTTPSPLRAPRAPQPPLPWLPSSARRGAPFSGHSLPKPTP